MKLFRWMVIFIVGALLTNGQTSAQDDPPHPLITPDNVDQMTQLAMMGRGQIRDLAWSPDGHTLAVATTIGVWLYHATEPELLPVLLASQIGPVTEVVFNSDGTFLAASSLTSDDSRYFDSAGIQLWDIRTRHLVGTWSQNHASVGTLAFAPQGELRAAVADFTTNGVTIWQFSLNPADQRLSAAPISVIADPKIETRDFAFSADTSRLVISGGTITGSHQTLPAQYYYTRIWDTATGEEVTALHTVWYTPQVAINASADLVATVTDPTRLEVWDTHTQSVIAAPPMGVGPMEFSGPWLAYAAQSTRGDWTKPFFHDTQLILYNLETDVSQPLTPVLTEVIKALAFSPDGSTLAAASSDSINGQSVRLFDTTTGTERTVLPSWSGGETLSLPSQINGTWFTPDGSRFMAYSLWSLQVWDAATGMILFSAPTSDYTTPLAISPDSHWLAVSSTPTTVSIWNIDTGQIVATLPDHGGRLSGLTFSPDSTLLVSTSESPDWTTRIWNTADWTLQTVIESGGTPVFAPQSTLLALAQGDTVQLWDLSTTTLLGEYEVQFAQEPSAVLFSPDGALMLYGRGFYRTMIDTQTGATLYEIEGRWGETFSPDGTLVAIQELYDITFEGSRVILTDAATGQEYASLEVPGADYFIRIAFSADGKLILATEFHGRTTIWDVATKTQLVQLPYAVVFNPDGTLVAGASPEGTIHIWDTTTWTELATLRGHTYRPSGLQFSPDGTLLLSSNDDGTLRLWGVSSR